MLDTIKYQFAGFTYQWDIGKLEKPDGATVRLSAKINDLMLVFVQNPGVVLSIDELMKRAWGNQIVQTCAVQRRVPDLRRALENDHRNPTLITTASKIGYRFTPSVSRIDRNAAGVINQIQK